MNWRQLASVDLESVVRNVDIGVLQENIEHITFADLTEEQVKGWVESQLDLDAIKSDIAARIELQKNPPTVVKSNPWGGEDEV